MSSALQDKTAVILGGTSGMGLASAKRFLAEGARVHALGLEPGTNLLETRLQHVDIEKGCGHADVGEAASRVPGEPSFERRNSISCWLGNGSPTPAAPSHPVRWSRTTN